MVKGGGRKKKNSARQFYPLLGLIAAGGIGALVYAATRPTAAVATVDPNLPPLEAKGYLLGNPNAPVKVVEFADFECPACSHFATLAEPDIKKRLIETGIISYRFLDYPLDNHRNTWPASHAAACANDQGKFWEMHDRLFNGQDQWNSQATSRPKSVFERYAREIGLNVSQWEECFDSRKHQRQIQANKTEGDRRGVGQTPTFVIGNKMVGSAISYDRFKAYVDSALALQPRDSAAAAPNARTDSAKAGAAK